MEVPCKFCLNKTTEPDVQPQRDEDLSNAVCNGNTRQIKKLLNNGADINRSDGYGTPLMKAIYYNRGEVVKLLTSMGANINAVNGDGNTPLALSIQYDRTDIAKHLINIGANVCKIGENGRTPLSWAVYKKNMDMIELLLAQGAKFTIHTACLEAIEANDLKIVRLLIDKGAHINFDYKDGGTPLIKAVETGNLEIIDELLKNGALVNKMTANGQTPLIKGVQTGNLDVVKILMKNGAKVNMADREYNVPIMTAIDMRNFDIFKFLVEHGANLLMTLNGLKPFMKCVMMENYEMVKYFVERGENVSQIDNNGQSPLSIAAANFDFRMFEYLLEAGADPNLEIGRIDELATKNDNFAVYVELLERENKIKRIKLESD